MKQHRQPCKSCPFSRSVEPGALGGSPVEMYIGQSVGPFLLPCHKTCDLDDPDWKKSFEHNSLQCAGAAIYRANIGVANLLPSGILRLPQDKDTVFASHAEFVAHHLQVRLYVAEAILRSTTPAQLLRIEMSKPEVRFTDRTGL